MATLKRENTRLKRDMETLSAQFAAIMGQLKAGVPVPGAMVPMQGVPGLAHFQAMQTPGAGPTRGEGPLEPQPEPEPEPRKDMMANIPQVGRPRKSWGKLADKEE